MSKTDRFIEDYYTPPNSGYGSQSPQANRGSAQDHEQHSKGAVQDSSRYAQRVSPENAGAEKVDSSLDQELINRRADRI